MSKHPTPTSTPTRAPTLSHSTTAKPRALFDTNIFISYLLPSTQSSIIRQLIEAAFDGAFTLLMAQEIAEEFAARVASKQYLAQRISKEAVEELIKALLEVAEAIPALNTGGGATAKLPVVTRDAKDDYLLAYALLGRADYLVTGDDDLLVLKEVEGVKIVQPAAFLKVLQG